MPTLLYVAITFLFALSAVRKVNELTQGDEVARLIGEKAAGANSWALVLGVVTLLYVPIIGSPFLSLLPERYHSLFFNIWIITVIPLGIAMIIAGLYTGRLASKFLTEKHDSKVSITFGGMGAKQWKALTKRALEGKKVI